MEHHCAKDTTVILSDGGAEIKGPGARFEAGCLTISTGGAYLLSGSLSNGQVIVDTGEEKQAVQLILDGVSIRCTDDAALSIRRAGDTDIYAMEDTESRLISGTERALVAAPAAPGAARRRGRRRRRPPRHRGDRPPGGAAHQRPGRPRCARGRDQGFLPRSPPGPRRAGRRDCRR